MSAGVMTLKLLLYGCMLVLVVHAELAKEDNSTEDGERGVRRRRQLSIDAYNRYVQNINSPYYDPRIEEGRETPV